MDCDTTTSTQLRSVRQPAWRCSRAATNLWRMPALSWRPPRRSPGNTGKRPNSVALVAEMLRLNGFSTAAFGKEHETAPWEVSPSGPTDRWPTRSGFDHFYGFIGGETNQWAPLIYDG